MAKPPANPFRFGPLALDEAFTDRQDEIASLVADARNGQDVVVFAPRRYGKSSLVWRVAQELVKDDVLVAQVDLMRTPTKDQLAAKLAKTIHEELATRLWSAKERLKVFADLRLTPTITVNPNDGAVSFSFDARAAQEDIDVTLEELLTTLGRIAAERERRVVLVLDEFQEVVDIDPGLIKLMRSVFQEQPEVAHIYLGSKRHMMRQIFNDENEPFWRSAKQTELGVIPPELFAPYALERFAETGKQLERDACERALELTGGHPYATQELLYFLWEATPPGETAGPSDDRRCPRRHPAFRALALQPHLGGRLVSAEAGPPGPRTGEPRAPAEQRLPAPSRAAGHTHRAGGAHGARARGAGEKNAPRRVCNRRTVPHGVGPEIRELSSSLTVTPWL